MLPTAKQCANSWASVTSLLSALRGCLISGQDGSFISRAAETKHHKLSGSNSGTGSLTVLEVRCVESRSQQGHTRAEGSRADSAQGLPQLPGLPTSLGIPWRVGEPPQSLPLSSHCILRMCLCLSSSYKDARYWIKGPH